MGRMGVLAALFAIFAIFAIDAHAQNTQGSLQGGGGGDGSASASGCANDATAGTDGCVDGLTFQQAAFFTGYANQSFGKVLSGITVQQPATYANPPAWWMCGIQYGCGLPNTTNIGGLKDPANIGSDSSAHDCTYSATPGNAFAPNGGAYVRCTVASSSTDIVIDGYNFGLHGCTALILGQNGASAAFVIRNSLFVNGPNCNATAVTVTGGTGDGAHVTLNVANWSTAATSGHAATMPVVGLPVMVTGMAPAAWNGSYVVTGVTSTSVTYANTTAGSASVNGLAYTASSANTTYQIDNPSASFTNPVTFTKNTVYGCGADVQGAEEAAQCGLNFPTCYFTGMGAPQEPCAPLDNHFWQDFTAGDRTITYNAFLHLPGRGIQGFWSAFTEHIDHNYVEGLIYPLQGEHGEFKEYGTRSNGTNTVYYQYNTFLQTKYVYAGAGLGSEAPIYLSSGAGAGAANITSITCTGTACTLVYTLTSGVAMHNLGTFVPAGTSNAHFDGVQFTVTTDTVAGQVGFACAACSGDSVGATGTVATQTALTFAGSVDHNVLITNVNPNFTPYVTTSVAGISFSYNIYNGLSVSNNYVDGTGSYWCWTTKSGATVTSLTFTSNANLAVPSDTTAVNQLNVATGSCPGTQH